MSMSPRGRRRIDPEAPTPFLKWAGGKRKVVPHLKEALPASCSTYYEPFVGGGALFFALAGERPRRYRRAVLCDSNARLVSTYRAVRDDVEALIERLVERTNKHCKEYFLQVRAAPRDEQDDLEVASWLIYLNKTAFNGLYRVNSKNLFNVPFGRYVNPNICPRELLRACSRALQGVDIRCQLFEKAVRAARPGSAIYFDPPFVPLSTTASFTSYTQAGFGPHDQVRLRDVALELKGRGVRVALSNHDTPEVRELYGQGFEIKQVRVARAINSKGDRRGKVGELIIT